MATLNLAVARAEALFASTLASCEPHDRATVQAAIRDAVHDYGGVRGCAGQMATVYGESEEYAAQRMRWALATVEQLGTRGTAPVDRREVTTRA